MRIRLIDTIEEFRLLREDWDDLLSRSRQDDPYLSHGWIEAWWDEYARENDRLHVLCCHEASRSSLVGAFPAYTQRTVRPLPTRRLRLLSDDTLAPRRLGYLADPVSDPEVRDAVVDHLVASPGEWDVLDLRSVDTRSPFLVRIADGFGDARVRVRPNTSELCPVALPDSWDEFLGKLSPRMRADWRRAKRQLDACGVVELERVTELEALEGALQEANAMFEQRMTHRYGRPFSVSDRYARFHASVSERLFAQGSLRLLFVRVDGQRVAYVYDIRQGSTMFSYRTAFDSAWASFSVGTLVNGYAIKLAIDEGCTLYDHGPGSASHKTRWGASDPRDISRALVRGDTPAGRTAVALEAVALLGTRMGRRLVPAGVRARLALTRDSRELDLL